MQNAKEFDWKQEFADFIHGEYAQRLEESRTYMERVEYLLWYYDDQSGLYDSNLALMGIENAQDLRQAVEASRYELALAGILADIWPLTVPVYPQDNGGGDYTIAKTEDYLVLTVYDYDRLRWDPRARYEMHEPACQVVELCVAMLAPAFRQRHHLTVDRQGLYKLCTLAEWAGVTHGREPLGFEEFDQTIDDGWDHWLQCGVVPTEYYNLYAVDLDRIAEVEARVSLRAARARVPDL